MALRISEEFDGDWREGRPALVEIIMDSTRRDAEIPSRRLQMALGGYSQQVASLRLLARGIDASVATPLNVATQDLATAEAKRGVMLAFILPYFLILTCLLYTSRCV